MIIRRCGDCPFFSVNLLALLRDVKSGNCGYDAHADAQVPPHTELPHGSPEREAALRRWNARLVVPDHDQVPDGCPLHTRDVVLTLGH